MTDAEDGPETYGERIAATYDDVHPIDATDAVDALAALSGAGPVLELGIGTGRVALPLAARGIEVHGIDASPAMIARLAAKPGGDAIPVAVRDFVTVEAPGDRYSLVFVAFNTFFALLTQDDQVRCFERVASRLAPGGRFVLEAFVPDLTRFSRGQSLTVTAVSDGRVRLDAGLHDAVGQRVTTAHVDLTETGTALYPVRLRYAWPAELDLMARLAGLTLEQRWAGWTRSPFTAASGGHVSVYAVG